MLPERSYASPSRGTLAVRTSSQRRPSFAHAAAVWRPWLVWSAPNVITVSAPASCAAPRWYSSLRSLLPPAPSGWTSSRLSHRFDRPSASPSRGAACSGVGQPPRSTRGIAASAASGNPAKSNVIGPPGSASNHYRELKHFEAELGQRPDFTHADPPARDAVEPGIAEQRQPGTQQHRSDLNVQFVGQPGPHGLPDHARADHLDRPLPRGRPRLLDRRSDPIGHEGEGDVLVLRG